MYRTGPLHGPVRAQQRRSAAAKRCCEALLRSAAAAAAAGCVWWEGSVKGPGGGSGLVWCGGVRWGGGLRRDGQVRLSACRCGSWQSQLLAPVQRGAALAGVGIGSGAAVAARHGW